MSEFSEAYYLKSDENREAIFLLRKAGVEGYVYPARDGWVTFVADTSPLYKFSEKLKEANTGILVQLVKTDDYGWGFEICAGNESVCSYYCSMNEDMDEEELYRFNRKRKEDSFKKLLKDEGEKFEVLKRYFDDTATMEDVTDVCDFIRDMKLYFSDWISYHYAELQDGEFEKYGDYENLKLIKVNKN